MRHLIISLVIFQILTIFLLGPGCIPSEKADVAFKGRVVHVVVEGGFYGIRTEDGKRLDPVNLPDGFKEDGLKVSGRYVEKEGASSIHMWGSIVELTHIESSGSDKLP